MIRSIRAELLKLRRRSVLWGAVVGLPGFALLATALEFVTAKSGAPSGGNPVVIGTDVSLEELALAGGLTRGFSSAATFAGLIVFVLFLSSMTGEYGQGTLRVALTRQPRRGALLFGKLVALLGFIAATLIVAEVVGALASVVFANVRGVPTGDWFTVTGLTQALSDYGNALLASALFGTSAVALGALLRSTMIGLAIGLAWLGPFEHILQLSWSDAARWMPGLLFDAVDVGGSSAVPYTRALILSIGVAAVLLVAGTVSFVRRDVTT
jgi:ABC-2 type transport system permease protein